MPSARALIYSHFAPVFVRTLFIICSRPLRVIFTRLLCSPQYIFFLCALSDNLYVLSSLLVNRNLVKSRNTIARYLYSLESRAITSCAHASHSFHLLICPPPLSYTHMRFALAWALSICFTLRASCFMIAISCVIRSRPSLSCHTMPSHDISRRFQYCANALSSIMSCFSMQHQSLVYQPLSHQFLLYMTCMHGLYVYVCVYVWPVCI